MEIFSIVLKIVFIVFFFGFCVFIHELGHLLAALWQGLHVEKFSVGMGPKIWGFKYKGVEYVISWLPFGGYVSLPQLDPTDSPQSTEGKELPHASARARAITAFAGPFFNVLFGFVLAAIMWGVGLWMPAKSSAVMVQEVPVYLPVYSGDLVAGDTILAVDGKPVPAWNEMPVNSWEDFCYLYEEIYGSVNALPEQLNLKIRRAGSDVDEDIEFTPSVNPEWQAGLRKGDRIIAVNDVRFSSGIEDFRQEYVYNKSAKLKLTVVRDGKELEFAYTPAPNPAMENLGFPFFIAANPLKTGEIAENSVAAAAGMKADDELLAVNGKNILGVSELSAFLNAHAGKEVNFQVGRNGEVLSLPPFNVPAGENLTEHSIGISFRVLAVQVMPDSPAAEAGIRFGDVFRKIEVLEAPGGRIAKSVTIVDVENFTGTIRESDGKTLNIVLERDGEEIEVQVTPTLNKSVTPHVYQVGIVLSDSMPKVIEHVNPWRQFSAVMGTTCRTLGLLFRPITSRISSIFTGEPADLPAAQIGVKHMSGPPGILLMLWMKLQTEGYRGGFAFIILITFSLAFMNLLPLPVLDGGHICFAALEGITRKRIPAKFFKYIYNFFAYLLIGLMIYIMVFDGKRVLKLTGSEDDSGSPVTQEEPAEKGQSESEK